jgi:hypothetical protein
MKTTNSLLIGIAALGVALFAPQSGSGQTPFTGPLGLYTNPVSGPTNAVWDVTTSPGVSAVATVISDNDGGTRATFSFPASFEQTGAGKFVGDDTTTVSLGFLRGDDDSSQWETVDPYDGTFKISGSISSGGGKTRGVFNASSTGMPLIAGLNDVVKSRRAHSAQTIRFTIDNEADTFVLKITDGGSISGLGSKTSHRTEGPDPLGQWIAGDGTWTLTLNVATAGKVVIGSALVVLNSGGTFVFYVRGVYSAANEKSTLVLKGLDTAKGSNLVVKMEGNLVRSIKGKISGQTVKIVY